MTPPPFVPYARVLPLCTRATRSPRRCAPRRCRWWRSSRARGRRRRVRSPCVTTCRGNARRHTQRCARCRALGAGRGRCRDNTHSAWQQRTERNLPSPRGPGCFMWNKIQCYYQGYFHPHFLSLNWQCFVPPTWGPCWVLVLTQ
jgi:hypothetical protein